MSSEGIDGEMDGWIILPMDPLAFQVDFQLQPRFGVTTKILTLRLREGDGEHPILHCIVAEDLAEAGCNDTTNSKVFSVIQSQVDPPSSVGSRFPSS